MFHALSEPQPRRSGAFRDATIFVGIRPISPHYRKCTYRCCNQRLRYG
jgi:hypothetical protein